MIAENNATMELPDHTFLVTAGGGDTKGHLKQFIACFDSTAKLLWIKEYDKPMCAGIANDIYISVRDFKPDGFGNWLMLTTINCNGINGQSTKMLLTKLDSSFSVIWYKDFGDDKYDSYPARLHIEPDHYMLAGSYGNGRHVQNNFINQAEIFKTDTSGNQIWHWKSDKAKLTGIVDIIKSNSGGYIFCGGLGKEFPNVGGNSAEEYNVPWVEKIDSLGNTIWADTISYLFSNANYNSITKMIELPDGDIIAAGSIVNGFEQHDTAFTNTYGILLRLRADGTIKWKRKYTYQGAMMDYTLYDMKRAADGGYVIAGIAYDRFNATAANYPWQRAWLLKVDSNGCMSNNDPQCWAVSVPEEPRLAAGSYQVYPNPVTDQLLVSYQKADDASESFIVTDITGRVVAQSLLSGQTGLGRMDLRSLPSGMYLYRIMVGKTMKQGGKISKY